MRSRRPGSKGTEWLLIKKRDQYVQEGFDANSPKLDWSVLTKRSLEKIAKDAGSAAWESSRKAAPSRGSKADWLKESIAIADKRRMKTTEDAEEKRSSKSKPIKQKDHQAKEPSVKVSKQREMTLLLPPRF